MGLYKINEIFSSLQGEGFNTGRPVVFIRFAGCNLDCVWCDTDCSAYEEMDDESILAAVAAFGVKSIVITGGEPTANDNLLELTRRLKQDGYWIALETNGVNGLPEEAESLFDYIAVSPKAAYAALYEQASAVGFADEVRVVVDGEIFDFCKFIEDRIVAHHYYLSPCCGADKTFNALQTIQILGQLNTRKSAKKWGLSLQTHKMADIR